MGGGTANNCEQVCVFFSSQNNDIKQQLAAYAYAMPSREYNILRFRKSRLQIACSNRIAVWPLLVILTRCLHLLLLHVALRTSAWLMHINSSWSIRLCSSICAQSCVKQYIFLHRHRIEILNIYVNVIAVLQNDSQLAPDYQLLIQMGLSVRPCYFERLVSWQK